MTLKQTKQRGFTIVELLIVVVIIAILAAITIVAYNGIQNRAKASSAQSLANTIVKKAEAFYAVESSYPASNTGFGTGAGTAGNPAEAKLDNASQVTGTVPTDEKTVSYKRCATGAQVIYFDASKNTAVGIGIGGAASTATGATLCT
jgi:prepilin-type N-terminal cleavage/methylation domain-containing protein